jgi:hypothetical protein
MLLQNEIPDFAAWRQHTLALVAKDLWNYAKELEAKIELLQEQLKEKK